MDKTLWMLVNWMPIPTIVALGCCSGLLVKRWISGKWKSAFVGAGIATIVWVGGLYNLFWFTAGSELGPPLLGLALVAYLVALPSAAVAIWIFANRDQDPNNGVDGTDAGPA